MKAILSGIICLFIANVGWAGEKLVITGASTIAPLINEVAKRYEAENKDVRIDVQTGGSSRGIADVRQGLADIGMVSRPLKDDEKKDLKNFVIAKDGVTVIVHKDNPIQKLSDEQIISIYSGKVTNWKDVGGKDARITVVNKAEGRSTLELFLNHFKMKNTDIKPHIIIGDNEQGIKTVSGNPNSIGYVSIGSAEYSVLNGGKIKLLPISGIAATVENVRKDLFALSRPLNLVVKGEVTGLKKKFIEFASSKKVNDLVEQQYFVPIAK